jgi:hypothetical protein
MNKIPLPGELWKYHQLWDGSPITDYNNFIFIVTLISTSQLSCFEKWYNTIRYDFILY